MWRCVLVDSFTQAGKTNKCFKIINKKIIEEDVATLVLFVTQANSTASANQVIQRAKQSVFINSVIPSNNIVKSNKINVLHGKVDDNINYMIVDFWNSKNMDVMLDFVHVNKKAFKSIIIVQDESDQNCAKGLKDRLTFIRNVEMTIGSNEIVKVIFVTASIPNLSKSVLQIAKMYTNRFSTGVVSDIISKPVVEHQFAEPHSSYVGASWFLETPDVYKPLSFPKKKEQETKAEYFSIKENVVMEAVKALPKSAKELTLFVTSSRIADHTRLAKRLYDSGYNVMVELNGKNSKNFIVSYINKSGYRGYWQIPYLQIDMKADRGNLKKIFNILDAKNGMDSGISCKEDYSLSHVLQAALFMMTDADHRIKENVTQEEYNKLLGLSYAIYNLDRDLQRPNDYPDRPRVALIAGNLAGRGITIQNPGIDFTCTSFCFTDTKDSIQRGAVNTQRFGRACGSLLTAFNRPNRRPIMVATPEILKDALANEKALQDKADSIENGTLISLKDLVTASEWKAVVKATKINMKEKTEGKKAEKEDTNGESEYIDGVNLEKLKRYYNSTDLLVGKMIRFLYIQNAKISMENFKSGVGYEKTDIQFIHNIENGVGIKARHGKLWCHAQNEICINPNIKEYVDKYIK